MPAPALRRPLTIAGTLSVTLGLLLVSPLLFAVAAVAQLFGRRKPLIALRVVLAYCLRELAVLLAAAGLWLAAGAGRFMSRPAFQRWHWELVRWYIHGIADRATAAMEIEITEEPAPREHAALEDPAPVIVLSRHAGPGDTLFLIDRLMSRYGRRPSVVLRQAITLDPAIDLLTARLPQGVIDKGDRDASEALIEELSAGLRPHGALLLYPEGGNFTLKRRRSALASLRRKGRHRAAEAAQQLDHVLPPRPTGVLAALRGNPQATVLFAAHTGLGTAAYPREIYREMPIGGTLHLRFWRVEPEEIPATEDGQVGWLNEWWRRIDDWVGEVSGESSA
jgi:hypothetical protein